jgi:hypothetical protein
VGGPTDHGAPEWLTWNEMRTFQQSRAAFIGLFANMAMWPANLAEVCAHYRQRRVNS